MSHLLKVYTCKEVVVKNFVHVLSDNIFIHEAVDKIIEENRSLTMQCCGNLVILDTVNISPSSKLAFPQPVCHVIFIIARDSHKSFLSSYEWGVSVSYVKGKSSPDYLKSELLCRIFDLKRKIICNAFYNSATEEILSERELSMISEIMQGECIKNISNMYNLDFKTMLNYRSKLLKKAFYTLDTGGVRLYHLTKKLSCSLGVSNTLDFHLKKTKYCLHGIINTSTL